VMQPHLIPHHNIVANLIYSANGHDVTHTIVDGRLLMDDRVVQSFDEDSVMADAIESAARVKARWEVAQPAS
jgi:5-methylthioadenosine/S-adenosylhomocysteine deaminase